MQGEWQGRRKEHDHLGGGGWAVVTPPVVLLQLAQHGENSSELTKLGGCVSGVGGWREMVTAEYPQARDHDLLFVQRCFASSDSAAGRANCPLSVPCGLSPCGEKN